MSQSTTAARKSGGSASSAGWTSSSKWLVVVDLGGRGLAAGEPVAGVVGEGVEADALLAAHLVEEQVGGDAVQPALEGAGRVGRQGAEDPDEDVLGEVLGVVGVAGEAVGEPVDARGVGADDLVPAWAASSRRAASRAGSAAAGSGGRVSTSVNAAHLLGPDVLLYSDPTGRATLHPWCLDILSSPNPAHR